MSITRRLFLRGIPIAGAAARGIAETAASHLAGTVIPDGTGIGVLGTHKARVAPYGEYDDDDEKEKNRVKRLWEWVSKGTIPAWKRRQMRETIRYNRVIDPDIAVLRSVSLTSKVRMQWDRDEKHMIERELRSLDPNNERRSWLKKMGIDYW